MATPANKHAGWRGHEGTSPDKENEEPHARKTEVLSLIESHTGEVRSQVIPNVTGATSTRSSPSRSIWPGPLRPTHGTVPRVGKEFSLPRAVNHETGEYLRHLQRCHHQQAERYFSQLKRSIDGTHHHVSDVHLNRYPAEFDYQYTHRTALGGTDTQRMEMLVGATPLRRLTYKGTKAARLMPRGRGLEGTARSKKGSRSCLLRRPYFKEKQFFGPSWVQLGVVVKPQSSIWKSRVTLTVPCGSRETESLGTRLRSAVPTEPCTSGHSTHAADNRVVT